ncbi:hypothetical protein BDV25DRAFT_142316 [Aspergillus avenaceus]|uniref:Uncharacterized protein n=1 Tax=Aspergillus avenaceus TaxID=36643 RepID=A0A5N6TP24_ASPAV|nr:hypothetical protein BDV25DRAFT_142316 [Aspergillus avenaceus]
MWWLALTGAKKVSKWGYKEYRKKHNNDNNNPTSINMANLPYPPPPAAPEPEVSTRARLKAQLEIGVYFLQVVFGLTVVGLYARERMNGMNAKWVYAFLTGLVAADPGVHH